MPVLDVTVDRLVLLGRRLRSEGLTVTPEVVGDMARAVELVGYDDPNRVYSALRSVVVTDRAQLEVFDRAMREFFGLISQRDGDQVAVSRPTALAPIGSSGDGDGEEVGDELEMEVGASTSERLAHRDFADLDKAEAEAVRALIAQMLWSPPDLRTRRRARDRRGDRPDLRRSLRSAAGPRGDLMPLEWTKRRVRTRPLIIIADISGSMEAYAEMFLAFAHAARRRFGPVETFVFSTRLTRITRALDRRDLGLALHRVGTEVEDWSGGTKIGEAFAAFNREWSRRVCRGRPYVLILSDGWDCGDPDMLRREMARLSRTVERVIWLNPLAARDGYAPETRGMRAALPFVDDFLPAASVGDLRSLVALLDGLS